MQSQNNRNRLNRVCLSLWQWALLSSIIIFIITAVLTTCAALGKMHTQQISMMIKRDLDEEEEKREMEFSNGNFLTSNEVKLQLSQHFIFILTWILSICTCVGCVNLLSSLVMIYGICTRKSCYVIPWILISGMSYLLVISGILAAYLEMLPGISISFNVLSTSLTFSSLFIILWYTILLYYTQLTTNGCTSHYPMFTTTVIQAYGGYMHTVTPSSTKNEKKEII